MCRSRFVALLLLATAACACSDALDLGRNLDPQGPEPTGGATCDGAPCFLGPVEELASSEGNAKGLVLDATNAYFAASFAGAIIRVPKAGGPSTAIPAPEGGPYLVSGNASHVHFTSQVGGYVASLDKASDGITLLASGEAEPSVVLTADDGVYFMAQTTGEVRRVALDGSVVETLVTGLSLGGGLALDADFLYFVDTGRGELWARDRQSGETQLLAGRREHPGSPLLRGGELYFVDLGTADADYSDGALLRMPRGGGEPVVLGAGLDAPTGIAADEDAVYVCTRGNQGNGFRGRVLRLSDGGELRTLAADQPEAHSIAVDTTGVYWTVDAADGLRVLRR